MLPTKVYVVSNKGNIIHGRVINAYPHIYSIGFFERHHAEMVRKRLDVQRPIEIVGSQPENVSTEVNMGLENFGVDNKVVGDLVIDVDARMRVPFLSGKNANLELDLLVKDTTDFLMWPLDCYLGVAMPLGDKYEEDFQKDQWVFPCQYIQPCMDFHKFMKNLKL